jgi:cytosine deaminase
MDIRTHFLNLVEAKGGFVPLHAHFDKSNLVTPELLKKAQEVSMQDKWALYRNLKNSYTYEDVYTRSEKALYKLIKQNCSLVRTFADADSYVGQMCVDALSELKENYSDIIDIEIAIQPLEGVVDLEARHTFEEACSKADLVGALPSRDKDPAEHLRIVFDIAKKYKIHVDAHLDQLNCPSEKETELFLDIKNEMNFASRTNAVHSISLACHDPSYQHEITKRMAEENVGLIICPSAALSMKPVNANAPIHNSIAPLQVALSNQVSVGLGIDNISDLFMPLVDGDMWFESRLLMEATRCYDLDLISTIATTYI